MAKIKCPDPDCTVEIDEEDGWAQKAHMDRHHPEIVAQRLRDSGFVQDPRTGQWVDAWASD